MIYNPPNNTHPIAKLLSRPYEETIPAYREKIPSIEKLSRDVHEVNPDYLLFHPIINSHQLVGFLMAYTFSWLFGQGLFFFLVVIFSYIFIKDFEYAVLFLITMLILFLIVFGFGSYLVLRQIKNKKSYYNKILLLKQNLAEGNIYQSSANPALHPEVKRRLMWDGESNPYNILPVTAERQAAFANQNQKVKQKWYSGVAINAAWFIGSILYVMLVIA